MKYFNDNEPYVAEWLRSLFPKEDIDARSVDEVEPRDLTGALRCHFFAGIGGWDLALDMASWPGRVPVWTASLPCQPFSTAGLRKGEDDHRHLWPVFRRLVAECLPPVIFGEQVASKDGRVWLARVRADLEALGYGVGASDLCAAGIGAPHIRQRLYWVAARVGGLADTADLRCTGGWSAEGAALQGHSAQRTGEHTKPRHPGQLPSGPEGHRGVGRVAYAERTASEPWWPSDEPREGAGAPGAGAHAELGRRSLPSGGMVNAIESGLEGHSRYELVRRESGWVVPDASRSIATTGSVNDYWSAFDLVLTREPGDETAYKLRRIEPGSFPLAHGIPARVGRIRAYGNAIVPPLAAEFVKSFMDVAGL